MPTPLHILVLEDVATDYELALRELRKEGLVFTAQRVETAADFRAQLQEHPPGLILADHSLPQYDGLSALPVAQELCPAAPFIFVSGALGEETAIEALKHGATDYVLKQRLGRLGPSVRRALHDAEDYRQRQQAEEKLRQSEDRFRSVAQTASDAIISADSHGRIVFWNTAATAIFGYAFEEAEGQPVMMIMPERFRRPVTPPLTQWFAGEETKVTGRTVEATGLRKDGREFPVEFSMATWLSDEQVFATGILRDISQRKQAEAERERLILQLKTALADVKTLTGIIPICAGCKKIRDDKGYWNQVEQYIQTHSLARFSHGLCPDCLVRLYPEYIKEKT
jgi:PAS domain S-box-containing protein